MLYVIGPFGIVYREDQSRYSHCLHIVPSYILTDFLDEMYLNCITVFIYRGKVSQFNGLAFYSQQQSQGVQCRESLHSECLGE